MKLNDILVDYQDEYRRHLKYIDPRNHDKKSDINLLNEHNQTVNFYYAIRKHHSDAIAWFELSFQTDSTNAFDAVIYIPEEKSLLIVEAKGLRKLSKYEAINKDLNRLLGQIKINIKDVQKVYAVILCDVWNMNLQSGLSESYWELMISKKQSEEYENFKNTVSDNLKDVRWWCSEKYEFGTTKKVDHHLLAMIGEVSDKKYIFN